MKLLELLVLTLFNFAKAYPDYEDRDISLPNTTLISQVLNRLTDKTKYDKRLRPKYGEGPVDVGVTIHVSSISAVSEVNMDFTLDFYLRQNWIDPRLAFKNIDSGFKKIESLTVGLNYLDRLWQPDTFFPNEKSSFFHITTTHNSFLRIYPNGKVTTSQRLTVIATCPMDLHFFPMDTQTCKLEIESYGYSTADISYFWGENKKEDHAKKSVAFSPIELPQFSPSGFRVNKTTAVTSTGSYDRLHFEIILKRNLGFYFMNIIIPSIIVVIISWVSFWINRESSPARTNLGVITVLTMTTLITVTNNQMPKVSYVKSLDVFLSFHFIMVFASLIEFAVVSYLNKKMGKRRELQKKRAEAQTQNCNNDIPPDCDCRIVPFMQYTQLPTCESLPPLQLIKRKKAKRPWEDITPARIDKCSRFVFPTLFVVFQTGYWIIMMWLSNSNDGPDYVLFEEH